MNKAVQKLFLFLFPFFPLWGWLSYSVLKKPVEFFVCLLLLPLVLYFIITSFKKLPSYLLWLLGFTVYHLIAVYVNDLVPKDSNWIYFFMTDYNVLACLFFIVIEYTEFEPAFLNTLNRNIFIVILLSLAVSVIQIKNPAFFFNAAADQDLQYVGEDRNFSIYSWINLNSTGITFPILIAIALNVYDTKKLMAPLIILACIAVSFLTRARYVMISAIIVLSQLVFNRKRPLTTRLAFIGLFIGGILLIGIAAKYVGVDVQDVINTRILEKQSDMASAKARMLSYDVFFKVFPYNPWFGVGPSTRADVVDALGGEAPLIHIGYLSYLYFYGIIGSSFLFISLFLLLKRAWKVGKKFNFWGCFYGLLTFVLANTTFVYFNLSEMGIVLAVLYLRFFSSIEIVEVDSETDESQEVSFAENIPVAYE